MQPHACTHTHTHTHTHTYTHTCQLYKELLAPFSKAKKKKKKTKNKKPSLGYLKKDFCIFSSLEICKGLENSSLSWGSFMNTLHKSVFYTEASDQTQAKPWKTAAECTQAPPSLRQASQQSPASCAPPPRWVRSNLTQQEPWARRLHLTVTFYIFHKQKAQLHVLTVWKAHSDRLLEALLSPEEALAGAHFFVETVVRKCAACCCQRLPTLWGGGEEERAADSTPDPEDRALSMDSGPWSSSDTSRHRAHPARLHTEVVRFLHQPDPRPFPSPCCQPPPLPPPTLSPPSTLSSLGKLPSCFTDHFLCSLFS